MFSLAYTFFTMALPTKTMLVFIFLMSMVSEKMLKSSAKFFVVKIWLILSELLYSWSEIVDCKHQHKKSPHYFYEPSGSVTNTCFEFRLFLFFTNFISPLQTWVTPTSLTSSWTSTSLSISIAQSHWLRAYVQVVTPSRLFTPLILGWSVSIWTVQAT